MKQKSYHMKESEVKKEWVIVDANDQILGRTATKVAMILMGKCKANFTPSMEMGDFVIVINADKIKVTGKKESEKKYYHHSGYAGGLKTISYKDLKAKHPERILREAVLGMLPKNRLRAKMIKNLKIYVGENHPHCAQKPVPVSY